MTDIYIPFDGQVVETEGGQGKPLEEGKYLVSILSTEKDKPGVITKRPFAKQGANTGITALAIRLLVADQQRGAGRNLFVDIPLARKFASGEPAYLFHQFFKALGYDVDDPQGFHVPEDRELLGQWLEVVINIEEDSRDTHLPPEQRRLQNRVRFINKATENSRHVSVTPPAQSAPAQQAAWTPGAQAAPPQASAPQPSTWTPGPATTPQQPPAQPGWVPSAADVQAAIPQQQVAAPQQPQQSAPQGWQPPQDAALAAAAAGGKGF